MGKGVVLSAVLIGAVVGCGGGGERFERSAVPVSVVRREAGEGLSDQSVSRASEAGQDERTVDSPLEAAEGETPEGSGSAIEQVEYEQSQEVTEASEEPGLALSEVIQAALASSPDLRSAAARIEVADATLERARAEFYPQLDAIENYGVSNNPVSAFMFQLNQTALDISQNFNSPVTTDDFHTQVLLRQELYTGGRRSAQADAARAQRDASTFDLQRARNELVYRAAEAYYRLLQARDLIALRREAVEQVRKHLEIVQVRYRAESAVKSDVLSVEVRFSEERQALISAENQLRLAWAVLENVIGAPLPRRALPDVVPPAPWSEHVDDVQAAVAEALARRPEIGQMAGTREAAEHDVQAARAGYNPSVDLLADYDVHTGDFGDGNDSFFVGLAVRLNFFDGGRTDSDVRRACARLRELQARNQRLVADVELGVRRAYLLLDDAKQRLSVASEGVGQAEEALREIEIRYRGEVATITELIDAQTALSRARVRHTTAQAELRIAEAALEYAIGRLAELAR